MNALRRHVGAMPASAAWAFVGARLVSPLWATQVSPLRILLIVLSCTNLSLAKDEDPFALGVRNTEPLAPAEQLKKLHAPPGFEIQLVASEPDINKPMNLAFDDRGRMWVTSTVEYPYPAKDGQTPRDTVIVLSDFADDGRARKVETFAEGVNIPIGILPVENG